MTAFYSRWFGVQLRDTDTGASALAARGPIEPARPIMQADLATITERVRRPRSAEVVRYRFFFSMTLEEVAKQTDCSVATVHRELAYARAFLTRSGI